VTGWTSEDRHVAMVEEETAAGARRAAAGDPVRRHAVVGIDCEHLGGTNERVRALTLSELTRTDDIAPLNVVLLVRTDPAWRPPPAISYLHEDAFAKRMPSHRPNAATTAASTISVVRFGREAGAGEFMRAL